MKAERGGAGAIGHGHACGVGRMGDGVGKGGGDAAINLFFLLPDNQMGTRLTFFLKSPWMCKTRHLWCCAEAGDGIITCAADLELDNQPLVWGAYMHNTIHVVVLFHLLSL